MMRLVIREEIRRCGYKSVLIAVMPDLIRHPERFKP
jgi:hypothetical protein